MITSSRRTWVFSVVLALSIVVGASPAFAEVVIHEVQIIDPDLPRMLVIYGTGFGDDPLIYLGTQTTAMVLGDQSYCSTTPPPPLDATGIECVVAVLPDDIPCGDYLLWLKGDAPWSNCEEDGKVSSVTFMFTGEDCSAGSNAQDKDECDGSTGPAPGPVTIELEGKDADKVVVSPPGPYEPGDEVTFTPKNDGKKKGGDKLPSALKFDVVGSGWTQYLNIHTSCSDPLNVGDQFGSMVLMGATPKETDEADLIDEYDLTICAGGEPCCNDDSWLLCFSFEENNNIIWNHHMGLGIKGPHNLVSLPIPSSATAVQLAVKVVQHPPTDPHYPSSGFGQLVVNGTKVGGVCELIGVSPKKTTMCTVPLDEAINQLDTLSVFISATDPGCFEAAMACVVLVNE